MLVMNLATPKAAPKLELVQQMGHRGGFDEHPSQT